MAESEIYAEPKYHNLYGNLLVIPYAAGRSVIGGGG